MELYRLTIPKDDAWRVIESLGYKNVAHFIDLNKSEQLFSLPYAFRLKMCDETERRINFLVNKCKELKVTVNRPKEVKEFTDGIQELAEEGLLLEPLQLVERRLLRPHWLRPWSSWETHGFSGNPWVWGLALSPRRMRPLVHA